MTKKKKSKLIHGTTSGYVYHKCRCKKCKKAYSDYSKEYRRVKPRPRKTWRHGTQSAYSKEGCRCPLCTAAHEEHKAKRRNGETTIPNRNKWVHGTTTAYRYGCRCPACKKAHKDYQHNKRASRNPPKVWKHGTQYAYYKKGCRCDMCIAWLKENLNNRKLGDFDHGTMDGYLNHGCKCDDCRAAYQEFKKGQLENLLKSSTANHGSTGYHYGCRCDVCVSGYVEYSKTRYGRSEIEEQYDLSGVEEQKKRLADARGEAKKNRAIQKKIGHNIRVRLRKAMNRNEKSGNAIRLLGCTIADFRIYLESQFVDGMTWENYGNGENDWSIDHIRPLNTFDLRDDDQLLIACHYTNLRPLWHLENIGRPKDGSDIAC